MSLTTGAEDVLVGHAGYLAGRYRTRLWRDEHLASCAETTRSSSQVA